MLSTEIWSAVSTIRLVSREWNNIARNLPRLWTRIDLTKPSRALHAFKRCGAARPLHLASQLRGSNLSSSFRTGGLKDALMKHVCF